LRPTFFGNFSYLIKKMTSLIFGKTMKNSFKLLILIFLFNTSISYASSAIGHCLIDHGNSFSGRCEITSHGKNSLGKSGGFSIGALDPDKPLYEDTYSISMSPLSKNKVYVRALITVTFDEEDPTTNETINSFLGEYVRDKKDPSCWNNEGRQICARKIK
jgi:hypothetical protein